MMALDPTPNRPWWKEPMVWMVIGLPAIAVVGSFTSYYFAARDPDGLVKADFRKEGFAVMAPSSAADKAAAALGLSARLITRNGQMELVLRGHLTSNPPRLALNIVHPSRENQDIHILLAHSRELSYIAPAPDLGSGKRILVLEPEDRAWRITGQWTAPFSGMTELVAGASKPSTHP
ncbi:MAG: FixH family protein [Gallionellaceae bacterium]|nr:FixH family protein [Gallionellaceae bacterium]